MEAARLDKLGLQRGPKQPRSLSWKTEEKTEPKTEKKLSGQAPPGLQNGKKTEMPKTEKGSFFSKFL